MQPPVRSSEVQRVKQATEIHDFVKDLSDKSAGRARVVVLGDLNDYQFSPALQTITGNGTLLRR